MAKHYIIIATNTKKELYWNVKTIEKEEAIDMAIEFSNDADTYEVVVAEASNTLTSFLTMLKRVNEGDREWRYFNGTMGDIKKAVGEDSFKVVFET